MSSLHDDVREADGDSEYVEGQDDDRAWNRLTTLRPEPFYKRRSKTNIDLRETKRARLSLYPTASDPFAAAIQDAIERYRQGQREQRKLLKRGSEVEEVVQTMINAHDELKTKYNQLEIKKSELETQLGEEREKYRAHSSRWQDKIEQLNRSIESMATEKSALEDSVRRKGEASQKLVENNERLECQPDMKRYSGDNVRKRHKSMLGEPTERCLRTGKDVIQEEIGRVEGELAPQHRKSSDPHAFRASGGRRGYSKAHTQ